VIAIPWTVGTIPQGFGDQLSVYSMKIHFAYIFGVEGGNPVNISNTSIPNDYQ